MNRSFAFSYLRVVSLAAFCSLFCVVYGQSSEQVNLSGIYAGELKFPSAQLNGKATLNVEGNKFVLRDANGVEKTGRITAAKTGDDFVSVAMMFDEKPAENQPFSYSIISVRLRKTGENVTFVNAPGESSEFVFQAAAPNANRKNADLNQSNLQNSVAVDCTDPAARCPISFGKVSAAELEKAAAPKSASKPQSKANRAGNLSKAKNALRNNLSRTVPKTEIAQNTADNKTSPQTTVVEKSSDTAKQNALTANNSKSEPDAATFREATDELRRATTELRRANNEVKAATDELRRFRVEKPAASADAPKAVEAEKSAAKTEPPAAPKTSAANARKSAAKKSVSINSGAKKSSTKKSGFVKTSTAKSKPAKPAASKRRAGSKATPAKPVPVPEKPDGKTTKQPETKPSPSPTPSPSPAKSPDKNANNANVGKSSR